VVVAVHHNGFGNQLFEYAFGRLWAAAAGSAFAAAKIEPREGPMSLKEPPNSGSGWGAFTEIFDPAALGDVQQLTKCAPLTPTLKEYDLNGTVLLAERPADTRRVRLDKQLARALQAADGGSDITCLKTIGYWQHYDLYAGMSGFLREALPLNRLKLSEEPGPDDIVVHARLRVVTSTRVEGGLLK